jgi:hypothetical protein
MARIPSAGGGPALIRELIRATEIGAVQFCQPPGGNNEESGTAGWSRTGLTDAFSRRNPHTSSVAAWKVDTRYPPGRLGLKGRWKTCFWAYRLTTGKLPKSGNLTSAGGRGLIRRSAVDSCASGTVATKGSHRSRSNDRPTEAYSRDRFGVARPHVPQISFSRLRRVPPRLPPRRPDPSWLPPLR